MIKIQLFINARAVRKVYANTFFYYIYFWSKNKYNKSWIFYYES